MDIHNNKVDVAILCVKPVERDEVLKRFPGQWTVTGQREYTFSRLRRTDGNEITIAIVRCKEGPIRSQACMRDIISDLEPRLTLLVGIAGGIPIINTKTGSLVLGDVVVSTGGLDVASGELDPEKTFHSRPKPFHLSEWSVNLAKDTDVDPAWLDSKNITVPRPDHHPLVPIDKCPEDWFRGIESNFEARSSLEPRVVFGAISSGPTFLRDPKLANQWRTEINRARLSPHIGHEMEMVGVHHGSQGRDRVFNYLLIKGVSDVVGLKRGTEWERYAASAAASYTFFFLKALTFPPKSNEMEFRSGALMCPGPEKPGKVFWQRYWCPPDEHYRLDEDGFLLEPSGAFGRIANPSVLELSALEDIGCLVLLGEPGTGKTTAVTDEFQRLSGFNRKLWWSLEEYGDETRLVTELFESRAWEDWLHGDYQLWLFIDALDEGLLRVQTLSQILIKRLTSIPSSRLHLRIVCRTIDWPVDLAEHLRSVWRDDYRELELLPLRSKDVVLAVEAAGQPVEDFLSEVEEKRLAPFAIKPVTLFFLLKLFEESGSLPEQQFEVYSQGCKALCSEANLSRVAGHLSGKLTISKRFEIARHIAAYTLLCARPIIVDDPDVGHSPSESLSLEELELLTGFSREELRETVSTGLFSSRGARKMGWAHHSYAEFLAAVFINENVFHLAKTSLLVDETSRLLYPQLQETGAWVSSMDKRFRSHVLRHQPAALLESTSVILEPAFRKKLTSAILELYRTKALSDWKLRRHYDKLKHPDLATQLLPRIQSSSENFIVRRGAIEIAQHCECKTLSTVLTHLALDEGEPMHARVVAAAAVTDIGDKEEHRKLQPLIFPQESDENDELRAYALSALWPDLIELSEMFEALSPPRNKNFFGKYQHFLRRELFQRLPASETEAAFAWLDGQRDRWKDSSLWSDLLSAAFVAAASQQEDNKIRNILAKSLVKWAKDFSFTVGLSRTDIRKSIAHAKALRRDLLLRIPTLLNNDHDAAIVYNTWFPKATSDEMEWLLEMLIESHNPVAKVWYKFVRCASDPLDEKQQKLIKERIADCPIVFDEVEAEHPKIESDETESVSVTQVAVLLNSIQALAATVSPTEPLLWLKLLETIKDRSFTDMDGILTDSSSWKIFDERTRQEVIQAGRIFVHSANPNTDAWWGTNSYSIIVLEGVRTLVFLLEEDKSSLGELDEETWSKWIPSILVAPIRGSQVACIFRHAHRGSPPDFRQRVLEKVKSEAKHHSHVFVLEYCKRLEDPKLLDSLLELGTGNELEDSAWLGVMTWLLSEGHIASQGYLERTLKTSESLTRKVLAGVSLAQGRVEGAWKLAWAELFSKNQLGEEFLTALVECGDQKSRPIVNDLEDEELQELIIWMLIHFPPEDDVIPPGPHYVSTLESIWGLREYMLRVLSSRTTPKAAEAFKTIADRFPSRVNLRWQAEEMRSNVIRETWKPSTTKQLNQIVSGKDDWWFRLKFGLAHYWHTFSPRNFKKRHHHGVPRSMTR